MHLKDECPQSICESYYRALIESTVEGILVHREFRPLFVNPAFVEMFGYNHPDEVLQLETIELLITPAMQEQVQNEDAVCPMRVDTPTQYELQSIRQDESVRWFDVTTRIVEWEDGPAVYLTLIDMTSRKAMEAEHQRVVAHLRQSHRLNILSTLASGLAHDFNNLLGVLLVNLEVGLLDLPSALREQAHFQAALEAGNRAKELAQRLFAMDLQDEEEYQPVDLVALIEEVRALMQPTLPETIVLNQIIDSQVGYVLGNEAQLHQVLMNLCKNAVQAMEEREGILEVRLDGVIHDGRTEGELAGLRAGSYARLQVRDSGMGLTPFVLEHLFDPLFTTKQDQGGTGLGLAIVYSIVAAHQGAITAANNPARGTTFTLYLPQVTSGTG
ncbi:two-component system sensor histidine kinase NtrB [Candidatus Entotheonella palauensis]|uniref:two-component system sensor histidine kinase NtrB n=1 Tax=Candidatus Entotheonella palauensis TaxID=93172 RepID=UPI000B7FB4F7|nr:ATP-binding protein [Candidatus Entotheonella palauensis]